MRRSVSLLLVPVLLSVASLAGCRGSEGKVSLPAAPAAPSLEPQDLAKAAEASKSASAAAAADGSLAGTMEARRRSTLSARVGGVVSKVHVRDGDRVEEGAALVSLDIEDFTLRRRQAEAGLAAARAQLSAAEGDWKRAKALVAEKAMPQAQFDAADARYQGARAGMIGADVGVAMAKKAERDATVRAPYGGVIVRRSISEGEYATVMPPTQLLVIEETGVLDLRLYAAADRASGVHPGDALTVRFPALDREMKAKVIQVLPPADPKAGTSAILVEVADPERLLRPGMSAIAKLSQKAVIERTSP